MPQFPGWRLVQHQGFYTNRVDHLAIFQYPIGTVVDLVQTCEPWCRARMHLERHRTDTTVTTLIVDDDGGGYDDNDDDDNDGCDNNNDGRL